MKPERWKQVKQLCQAALESEPSQREAFLKEACAGDETLRKEVESLLACQPEAEEFLESPAMELAAKALAQDQMKAPAIDLTGRTLAHYRIITKIGAGGMGVVYRAQDTHLERSVAIKVLPAEAVADLERKRRFVQEAKSASALNHPNIIHIYDIDIDRGIAPFLSPDDRWIGFRVDRKLMKVSVDGGLPLSLCEIGSSLTTCFGASWAADNTIVLATSQVTGLSRVSADGGKPEALAIPDKTKEEFSHRLPHAIPHSKNVLFTIKGGPDDLYLRVAALESETGKYRIVLEDAADACHVPTGHLVFLRQGTLMAVPFDLNKLEVRGQPVPIVGNVMQALNSTHSSYNTGAGQFSISDSGWLVYASGGILPDPEDSLVWVDQKGTAQPIAFFRASFFSPRVSPDGRQIAYRTSGKEKQPWVYDLSRATAHRLAGEGKVVWISWTPDGKRLVLGWVKSVVCNLYWQLADGSSPMERLTSSEYNQMPESWTPDGHTLAFCEWHPGTGSDICQLRIPEHSVTSFLNTNAAETYPEFSPDGRWLAYCSNESGRTEVYVRPFPGTGGLWQISPQGSVEPLWARSGKQLFYRLGNQVWAVDVQTEPAFSASKPRLLFEQPGYITATPIRAWDISPDGQRFLTVKLEERKPQPVTEMILVQNWSEELKRLAPAGNK